MKRDDYLSEKIVPIQLNRINNVDELLNSLKSCGFQGRNLGKALDILEKMIKNENCTTVLTLSGAMVPAGMGDIITTLIEHKLIDILISTGANIIHDLVDAFANIGHYLGDSNYDDDSLFKHRINRIFDVLLPEENYSSAENSLLDIITRSFDDKKINITPSEFLRQIGLEIDQRCIVSASAKNGIPIFIPAFSDSELALNLIKYSVRNGYDFQFDILKDVQNFATLIKNSKECGTLIIGGGVPRNWAQQVFPLLDQLDQIKTMGYNYSVRIHTATEYDGGLSGCTVNESKSWGKYSLESKHASVWCDATIALPILSLGLMQRLKII